MLRFIALLAAVGTAALTFADSRPAEAALYNVVCIAPNGSWCRIACSSNRGVACYANVVNGQCIKRCAYR